MRTDWTEDLGDIQGAMAGAVESRTEERPPKGGSQEDAGQLRTLQAGLTKLGNDVTKGGLKGLETHFTSAVAKQTKQSKGHNDKPGEVLFKFLLSLRSPFRQYYDLFDFVLTSQSAVRLVDKAPKGPHIRNLEGELRM